jgi:hypothetical protein
MTKNEQKRLRTGWVLNNFVSFLNKKEMDGLGMLPLGGQTRLHFRVPIYLAKNATNECILEKSEI